MRPVQVYLVQDRASGLFLKPQDGDVSYTPFVNEAGHFDAREAAFETAIDCCEPGFIIFPCYLDDPKW